NRNTLPYLAGDAGDQQRLHHQNLRHERRFRDSDISPVSWLAMSRRLEIELTSRRPDGTWTWRAAGAKQPKGEINASVVPEGVDVGHVVRADAEFLVDGIEILSILPPKGPRKEVERLEVVGTRRDEPLVTTQLVEKGRGSRDRERRGGGRRRDGDGPRGERSGGERRPRGPRPDPVPERPRPKRLRPGRTHRNEVLAQLPEEQRPVAEQVLRGGMPAVRAAIDEQNQRARAAGQPEVPAAPLIAMAEKLQPTLRTAEWLDRADAALRDLDELDLRDLRSVVVAGDGVTRDAASTQLLEQLQTGLTRRVEEEHANWLTDIQANLQAGRFIRALRLTSRPPKAGAPLPKELGEALAAAVSTGLTPQTNQDLWAAAIDALAVSPIRNLVTISVKPDAPNEALITAVRRAGDRLPELLTLFGVEAMSARERKRVRPERQRAGRAGAPAASAKRAPAAAEQNSPASVEPSPADGEPLPADAAGEIESAAVEPAPAETTPAAAPVAEAATAEAVEPDAVVDETADAVEAVEVDAVVVEVADADAVDGSSAANAEESEQV
ncbi:MAG: hypothetical protein ACKOYM_06960, partial [Actinomycetes bacterium]